MEQDWNPFLSKTPYNLINILWILSAKELQELTPKYPISRPTHNSLKLWYTYLWWISQSSHNKVKREILSSYEVENHGNKTCTVKSQSNNNIVMINIQSLVQDKS